MRQGRSRAGGTRTAAVPILILLAMAGPAAATVPAALSPGVHVDPNSPAAKEYAIPLEQARGGGASGGSAATQLFGSGITRAAGSTSLPRASRATSAGAGTHGRALRSRTGLSTPGRRAVTAQSHPAHPASAPTPDKLLGAGRGGSTGIAWMLGAAALVLALGVLGGAALTRRSRGTHPRTSWE